MNGCRIGNSSQQSPSPLAKQPQHERSFAGYRHLLHLLQELQLPRTGGAATKTNAPRCGIEASEQTTQFFSFSFFHQLQSVWPVSIFRHGCLSLSVWRLSGLTSRSPPTPAPTIAIPLCLADQRVQFSCLHNYVNELFVGRLWSRRTW